jgi:hypothetical protein
VQYLRQLQEQRRLQHRCPYRVLLLLLLLLLLLDI